MLDLFRAHAHEDARLLLHSSERGIRVYVRGRGAARKDGARGDLNVLLNERLRLRHVL